jgi:hypothetical protein
MERLAAPMDFFELLDERLPRDEREIEQVCPSFDMDCVETTRLLNGVWIRMCRSRHSLLF